jgi:uncharacterized glyoxalase superfamily protein PhnB
MEDQMADRTPNVFPALRFAEPDAAVAWLSSAFGFTERAVHRDEQGVIRHAEMSLGVGTIMFGQGDRGTHTVYVAVDDIDAHYSRARAAGAEITRELQDTPYGSREYSARDLEGNGWSFGTYLPEPGVQ